jgi:hypothetical protein
MYNDVFHMKLIGGELVGTSTDADEVETIIPYNDFNNTYVCRHTKENNAVGILK